MERLAQYYLPDDRENMKIGFGNTLGGISTKIEDVTTEKVSEFGDSAEVKITGGKMTIGVDGMPPIDLAKEGYPGPSMATPS